MSSNAAAALQHPQPGNEPSMEEILASIRRIIADDSALPKKSEAAPAPVMEEDDILDLAEVATLEPATDFLQVPEPVYQVPEPAYQVPEPVYQESMPLPVAASPPVETSPITSVAALEKHILSQETGAVVAQAFQALSRNVVVPQSRSLDDIVVEMLRPMLRGWLDDHLPGIVERLVKAEIERVARGE